MLLGDVMRTRINMYFTEEQMERIERVKDYFIQTQEMTVNQFLKYCIFGYMTEIQSQHQELIDRAESEAR